MKLRKFKTHNYKITNRSVDDFSVIIACGREEGRKEGKDGREDIIRYRFGRGSHLAGFGPLVATGLFVCFSDFKWPPNTRCRRSVIDRGGRGSGSRSLVCPLLVQGMCGRTFTTDAARRSRWCGNCGLVLLITSQVDAIAPLAKGSWLVVACDRCSSNRWRFLCRSGRLIVIEWESKLSMI